MAKAKFTIKLAEDDKATLFFDDEVAAMVGGTYVPLDLDDLLIVGPADGDEEPRLIEALIGRLRARLAKIEEKIEAETREEIADASQAP